MYGGVLKNLLGAADDAVISGAKKQLGSKAAGSVLGDMPVTPVRQAYDDLGRTTMLDADLPIFHGTSRENADAILKDGLMFDPAGRNNLTGAGSYGVSTSTNQDIAKRYGLTYGNGQVLDGAVPKGTKILDIDSAGYGVDDHLTYNQIKELQDQGYGAIRDISEGQELEVRLLQDFMNRNTATRPQSRLLELAELYGDPEAFSDDLRGTGAMFADQTGMRGREIMQQLRDEFPNVNPHQAIRDLYANNNIKTTQQAAAVDDYFMSHRPREDGSRAFDLTEGVDEYGDRLIPKDMYENWYGSRGSDWDKESIAALTKVRNQPDAEVTIYRASPKGDLNKGDWVTLSKGYAQQHADSNNSKLHSFKVKARDLRWAMDDINEFGYFPDSDQFSGSLDDFLRSKVGDDNQLVYHRTNATPEELAAGFRSKENTREAFVSDLMESDISREYGDNVVPAIVPRNRLRLDDEFPSGEQHFAIDQDAFTDAVRQFLQYQDEYNRLMGL